MPLEIIELEMTNFDSTSAIFKTLYLALKYYSGNCRGGGGGGGGISQGSSPPLYCIKKFLFFIAKFEQIIFVFVRADKGKLR